jgi:hypothetical protein
MGIKESFAFAKTDSGQTISTRKAALNTYIIDACLQVGVHDWKSSDTPPYSGEKTVF